MNSKALRNNVSFFLIILLVAIFAYFPQLSGEFIGDDVGRIEAVPRENAFQTMYDLLGDRPLLIVSVWLDRFFFNFDVFGMRLHNLILLAGLCLTFRILLNKVSETFNSPINPILRDGLLLLFAVHPINTQAVGHIIQRGILLSSLFAVLTTIFLLSSRGDFRKLKWKVALLLWCLALLAKPNIAFMPIWWMLLLIYVGYKKYLPSLAIFLCMLALPVIAYKLGRYNVQVAGFTSDPWEYFLIQGEVLLSYLRLMIYPWPLYFIYDFSPDGKIHIFPGLFLWGMYISGLILLWKKSSNLPLKIFVTGGFLAFLPESSFFPIIHPFFEHRIFTPMIFFVGGLSFVSIRINQKILSFILIPLIVAASVVTFIRSEQVRTYKSWVLNELNPGTCSTAYFVYYSIHQLLLKGEIEAAEQALKQVEGCPKNLLVGPLISAEINLAKSDTLTKEMVQEYKRVLHSDTLAICMMRNMANKFLVEKLLALDSEKMDCAIEDILSQQLRFLTQNAEKCLESLQYYSVANYRCFESLKSSIEPEDMFQSLKIRTIRFSYFNREDETLGKDLKKVKQDENIEYLLEIYEKVMADKKLKEKLSL